ncbi:DUF6438 domain-containing protein [Sphingomonas aracearum]|uniref:DUF6438 domain-containing protein n=1 Tax=Sphingomonas aracearum TaxID=2283317 RepID=A0A369VX22_9SPHN|nr:DUF6438 domain-containing protein [Sphingomonas aracearum]RDE06683.1 hypothetical protein DVW87_02995 [Sphingomonas aracearum]
MSILLAALALAGVNAPETITYETGRCFGSCPVYKVSVSADGQGTFEGRMFTAATGVRHFRVSKRQYVAFRRRLIASRPVGTVRLTPDNPACGPAPTDMPTTEIGWSGGGRKPAHLSLYMGCGGPKAQRMRETIRSAPEALPIAAFIGDRSAFIGKR